MSQPDPKNHIASVEKALRLLELFGDATPVLTISEIVARGGYSRTATYRLLNTLMQIGWVKRRGDGYQLSLRVFQLGLAALNALNLRREAIPVMTELAASTGETIYLMAPDGTRAVCLERIEGHSPVRLMVLDVGKSFPIHVGGGSLAILAHRPDLLEGVTGSALQLPTGASLGYSDLLQILRETRDRGYSRSIEDVTPGVAAFGVPVFDAYGQAIAALSIGGMANVLVSNEKAFVRALVEAGHDLSQTLGHGTGG